MSTTNQPTVTNSQRGLFDWTSYNRAISTANVGMKFHLVTQLLMDVTHAYEKFGNPLASNLRSVLSEAMEIRAKAKVLSEERNRSQAPTAQIEPQSTNATITAEKNPARA